MSVDSIQCQLQMRFAMVLKSPPISEPATAHYQDGSARQIQFLLGHVSVQTTERYLGCKQRLRDAVNDHIGIEPTASLGAAAGYRLPLGVNPCRR